MAGRSGSTFAKRQKERARQEKQREKMERRHQRKFEKAGQPQDSADAGMEPQSEVEQEQAPAGDDQPGPQ